MNEIDLRLITGLEFETNDGLRVQAIPDLLGKDLEQRRHSHVSGRFDYLKESNDGLRIHC